MQPDADPEPGPAAGLEGVSRTLGADEALQRGAWVVLCTLLALIAAGLFGRGGPLSDVHAASADGNLLLEYQRFVRYHSPDEISVTLRATGHTTGLLLDIGYAGQVDLERVTPEPLRVVALGEALRFEFHTLPGTVLHATIRYSAGQYGPVGGWVAVPGGARLPIRQFTYP